MTTNLTAINKKHEELILVSPRIMLFDNEHLTFQGVQQDKAMVGLILANMEENLETMRRGGLNDPTYKADNAEINTEYKQPIPYALISKGEEIFVYERLSGGGESRLHNKWSVGIGGHVNPENTNDLNEIIMINLERELEEELDIQAEVRDLEFIGLINDDENEVGRVHLGILASINLDDNATVTVRETEQLRGFWMSVEDLKKPENYERLESWSQIAVDIL